MIWLAYVSWHMQNGKITQWNGPFDSVTASMSNIDLNSHGILFHYLHVGKCYRRYIDWSIFFFSSIRKKCYLASFPIFALQIDGKKNRFKIIFISLPMFFPLKCEKFLEIFHWTSLWKFQTSQEMASKKSFQKHQTNTNYGKEMIMTIFK